MSIPNSQFIPLTPNLSIPYLCTSVSALHITGVNIASQFPTWLPGSLLYA